jgi:PleD family two-component response regulator
MLEVSVARGRSGWLPDGPGVRWDDPTGTTVGVTLVSVWSRWLRRELSAAERVNSATAESSPDGRTAIVLRTAVDLPSASTGGEEATQEATVSKILVVEDDEDTRDMVIFRLQQAGHRTRGVVLRRRAVDLLAVRGYPTSSCWTSVCRTSPASSCLTRLRELPGGAALPAVFLSARVTERDVAAGRALGAT